MSDDLNRILGIDDAVREPRCHFHGVHPSKTILALSVGILAAFFMPWVQFLGEGVSGYQLGSPGSYGNYAWVIPGLAGVTIVVALSGKGNRMAGAITGMPILALLYAFDRICREMGHPGSGQILEVAQHVVSIGACLTIAFSIVLLVCVFCRDASRAVVLAQSARPEQQPPPSQVTLTELERLAGLRAQEILTEAEFEEQKRQILG
jgi:hypothetical protein